MGTAASLFSDTITAPSSSVIDFISISLLSLDGSLHSLMINSPDFLNDVNSI